MSKKIFIAPLLLVSIVMLSGCSTQQNNIDIGKQNQQKQGNENEIKDDDQFLKENFEELTLEDLNIGDAISVVGQEDSSGAFSAVRIVVGQTPDKIRTFQENNSDKTAGREQGYGQYNEKPDFKNMSKGGRQKIMAQTNGRASALNDTKSSTVTRLNGEILDIDENSLTLKLNDGGSKLIYTSIKISIFRFKEKIEE